MPLRTRFGCTRSERNDNREGPSSARRRTSWRTTRYPQVSREVRHRDAILLLPTHVRVRLVRRASGASRTWCRGRHLRTTRSASRRTSARPSRSSRPAATATTCSGPASVMDVVRPNCFSCSRRKASWTRPRWWTRRRRRRRRWFSRDWARRVWRGIVAASPPHRPRTRRRGRRGAGGRPGTPSPRARYSPS